MYVPIPPPQRTKMGPQRRLGIYVGFESPSIIKYLEPMTGDQFTARYLDCQFNETIFPVLGGEDKEIKRNDIAWNATSMSFLDPRTNDSELEVQRIIHLQNVANSLPDAFIDTKKVTKSHILAENVPARLEVPEVTLTQTKASESQIRRKRGRPLGSKDANPRKRKEHIVSINHDANVSTSNVSEDKIPEVILSEDPKRNEQDLDDSYEMSINYAHNSLGWYRKEIKMNDIFAYSVAVEIMDEDDNDPQTMEECQHRNDWKSWKKAIQDELDSLNKREVFGPIIPTPKGVKPVGYKWVFVRKRNEQNEVVRYKARLVAQGFTQKPGIDYTETYSPVVDATTLRFLISLSVIEQLKMQLMDVVTAYLYGSLDTDIYMRIPEGLKMPEALKSKPRHMYSIKLKRSLYGLTQLGRMWYNRLSGYLIKKGFCHNQISPCLFIKRTESGFVIIAVYVDDLNIIGSPEEIRQAADYLKDAGYLTDPHKAISQSGYVFMYGGTAISWRSTKQTLVATSSNHAELIALYEAGRECVWLRSLIHYVCESCGLEPIEKSPTVIYEDNTACIAQIKDGYIKGDRTKHISPKFFSTHELQVEGKVDVKQIPSSQNLADLFTKALPTKVFKQLVHNIGMRRLKDICLN
ncbi:UNVERIFIED_CONTAM: Copia protein [Sesamum calycinum]|uniref:Copia protein n=1 Tax=Sesamum calycinum TaxID=2727403 RepID=A0AAW2RBR6_9LAMI